MSQKPLSLVRSKHNSSSGKFNVLTNTVGSVIDSPSDFDKSDSQRRTKGPKPEKAVLKARNFVLNYAPSDKPTQ